MIGLAVFVCFITALSAQTATVRQIHATGTGTVTIVPDQALFTAAIVTQSSTAQAAALQNATATDAVTQALNSRLSGRGTLKTIAYSIEPQYTYTSNQVPQLTGYRATNSLQVVSNDLTLIGSLLDAANQAGANSVNGLQFTLQNPEPVRQQALGLAAKQARAHADAIANGLGGHTGQVLSASENGTTVPVAYASLGAAPMATPITTGTLDLTATVSIDVELVP